ncbi:MAG: glutamate synthase small subunit [Kangiella sp.]|nr:MAG: glutamate synthase small subunit [Kangiella sp.]
MKIASDKHALSKDELAKQKALFDDPLNYISLPSERARKRDASERLFDFKEIYTEPKVNLIKTQAARCLDCGNPYCEWKCPLHNMIPNWLELTKNGHFESAASLMHETNPLPEICGRVCPQDRLCEQACTLQTGFGEVTIGEIEKTIADKALASHWRPNLSTRVMTDKTVAVVGAGPAGLGCAELLARNGVNVTVYDKYPEIGGLLTFGIPGFKLEKDIIKKRREFLEDIGIKFKLNTEIGKDKTIQSLQNDYDATFLGLGCYKPVDGRLEGQDSHGVIKALDYLIGNINFQEKYQMKGFDYKNLEGKRVVVLGGGDTAMDCVRSAVRQQAKSVSCVYRRDKNSMPGSPREVNNAIEEGVDFIFNRQPISINSTDGIVSGVNFEITNGNNENNQEYIETDVVIIAFGFSASPETWFNEVGIQTDNKGLTKLTTATKTDGKEIYAGGDMVSGADLVVTAIAQGRDAAKEILDSFDL